MNDKIKELMSTVYDEQTQSAIILTPLDLENYTRRVVAYCASTASMFSINKIPIHPDIPVDRMSEAAQSVYHMTCQRISYEITDLVEDNDD